MNDDDNTQPIKSLAEVHKGGRYLELEDGTIVPATDEAIDQACAAANRADGQAEAAAGAASGGLPPVPEAAA